MQPVVSAIIPIFNTGSWLPRCLDSICGQTLENIEIICVNDGSTDGSAAIVEAYARRDARILPINLGRNQGVSAARNIGLATARGEWLSFVDSDDSLAADFYEKLYAASKTNDAEIIKGTCWEEWASPNCINLEINKQIREDKFKFTSNWVSAIYNTNFIREFGRSFPLGCSHNEDFVFLYAALLNAKRVIVENDAVYHIFRRESSLSTSPITKTVVEDILHARHIMIDMLGNNIQKIGVDKYISEFFRIVTPLFTYGSTVIESEKKEAARSIAYGILEFFQKCHEPERLMEGLKRYDRIVATMIANDDVEGLAALLPLSPLQQLRYKAKHRMEKHTCSAGALLVPTGH